MSKLNQLMCVVNIVKIYVCVWDARSCEFFSLTLYGRLKHGCQSAFSYSIRCANVKIGL